MIQKSVDIREKQQENGIYSRVSPYNWLAFFYCMFCLQAVNVGTRWTQESLRAALNGQPVETNTEPHSPLPKAA